MPDTAHDLADAHNDHPSLDGRRILATGETTGIGRASAVLPASRIEHP